VPIAVPTVSCDYSAFLGGDVTKDQEVLIVGFIGAAFWIGAVIVLSLQAYVFLQDGVWPPFSIIDAGKYFTTYPWFYQPDQWLGLYKILHWIPVSLVLAAVGYFVIVSRD
jgi:hypothetical protein